MMVSPEWYYEENLKGKTVDELKSRIRSLKRKTRTLQKEIDNPNSDGCMIQLSPVVELEMHRLYLQKAVEALMDAEEYLGGDKP
jgi:hypothetical protein